MAIEPYLFFNGYEEAIEFYKKARWVRRCS